MENFLTFENYRYDANSGELFRLNEAGEEAIIRLQPQPARLLSLLIENYPNVVGHEQIQKSIWSDVQVDFEGSIHFCIRQIRAALNDRASDPKFIETIPRRGYRWKAAIEHTDNDSKGSAFLMEEKEEQLKVERASDVSTPINKYMKYRYWILGLTAMIGAFFYFYTLHYNSTTKATQNEKVRIAIMPFVPEDAENKFSGNAISIRLLETLTNEHLEDLEIVGPTTTADFQKQKIQKLIGDYKIDYLINGKFSIVNDESRLLAEIIRAKDGAHVWVKSFPYEVSTDTILLNIQNGLIYQMQD